MVRFDMHVVAFLFRVRFKPLIYPISNSFFFKKKKKVLNFFYSKISHKLNTIT